MRTNQQTEDTKEKYLSFRITRALWVRLGVAVRRSGVSTQAFCTEALERYLAVVERKQQKDPDDLDGKSARSAIRKMRGEA